MNTPLNSHKVRIKVRILYNNYTLPNTINVYVRTRFALKETLYLRVFYPE